MSQLGKSVINTSVTQASHDNLLSFDENKPDSSTESLTYQERQSTLTPPPELRQKNRRYNKYLKSKNETFKRHGGDQLARQQYSFHNLTQRHLAQYQNDPQGRIYNQDKLLNFISRQKEEIIQLKRKQELLEKDVERYQNENDRLHEDNTELRMINGARRQREYRMYNDLTEMKTNVGDPLKAEQ